MKLKVLILAPESPWPANSGGRLRMADLAEGLAQSCEVRVLAFGTGADTEAGRGVSLRLMPYPSKLRKAMNQVRGLLDGTPYNYGFYDSPAMRVALREAAAWADVLIVEQLSMAGLALASGLPRGLLTVLDMHNDEVTRAASVLRQTPTGPRQLRLRLHAQRLPNFQARAVNAFDARLFVSEGDRDSVMGARFKAQTDIVTPNCVAPPERVEAPASDPTLIVFTGALDYAPNQDAAVWLAREVLPLVRAEHPQAHVRIAGRQPPRSVLDLAALPQVEVLADVPEVWPHIYEAGIIAVPLRSGGGTKRKLIEALAAGKAIVTTSVGAEGLAIEDGRDVLIADDAQAFAKALGWLLADPRRAEALGKHASAAAAPYLREVVMPRLAARLEALVAERSQAEERAA